MGYLLVCLLLGGLPALGAEVSLSASDGQALSADHLGAGEKGVVLVHDAKRSRADWSLLAPKLESQGFQVLSLDLRGHGASKATLDDGAWPLMVEDVKAAVALLRKKGCKSVAVVGAHLGANLALNTAANDPGIDNVVLLSPAMNVHGVKVASAIGKYDRAILLVAGSDDALSAKAANLLHKAAKGDKHVAILPDAGSGTSMLNKAADLETLLIAWLNGTFHLSEGENDAVRELQTGEVDEIETTGTKLEDRYK